jgi:hypothetical protein
MEILLSVTELFKLEFSRMCSKADDKILRINYIEMLKPILAEFSDRLIFEPML